MSTETVNKLVGYFTITPKSTSSKSISKSKSLFHLGRRPSSRSLKNASSRDSAYWLNLTTETPINPYRDLPFYEETILFYDESDLELVAPNLGYYYSTKINHQVIQLKKKYNLQYEMIRTDKAKNGILSHSISCNTLPRLFNETFSNEVTAYNV